MTRGGPPRQTSRPSRTGVPVNALRGRRSPMGYHVPDRPLLCADVARLYLYPTSDAHLEIASQRRSSASLGAAAVAGTVIGLHGVAELSPLSLAESACIFGCGATSSLG
jgi:hypothetical protein